LAVLALLSLSATAWRRPVWGAFSLTNLLMAAILGLTQLTRRRSRCGWIAFGACLVWALRVRAAGARAAA